MRILAVGAAVPLDRAATGVPDVDPAARERLESATGIRNRRITGEDGPTALDLVAAAAPSVIERAGWSPESIDALLFVTQTPDRLLPGNACLLHGRLGLPPKTMAMDVNLGCSGFTYGLIVADSLLAAGRAKRVLLCVGDTISRVVDPGDRASGPLFGDAAGVAALDADGPPLAAVDFGTDGRGAAAIAAGGSIDERPVLRMDGAEVMSFAMRRVAPTIRALLERSGWSAGEVDLYLMHQANRFLLEHVARKAGFDVGRMPLSLDEFGNTSGASIPLTMVTRAAAMLESRCNNLLMVGFGVGFSWAGVALRSERMRVLPLIEVGRVVRT